MITHGNYIGNLMNDQNTPENMRRQRELAAEARGEPIADGETTSLDALIEEMVKAEDQWDAPTPREVLRYLIRLAKAARAANPTG